MLLKWVNKLISKHIREYEELVSQFEANRQNSVPKMKYLDVDRINEENTRSYVKNSHIPHQLLETPLISKFIKKLNIQDKRRSKTIANRGSVSQDEGDISHFLEK